MTLRSIAHLISEQPEVKFSFVQQCEEHCEGVRTGEFRVFVRLSDGRFCERTKPTIKEAISEVFAELKMEVPQALQA